MTCLRSDVEKVGHQSVAATTVCVCDAAAGVQCWVGWIQCSHCLLTHVRDSDCYVRTRWQVTFFVAGNWLCLGIPGSWCRYWDWVNQLKKSVKIYSVASLHTDSIVGGVIFSYMCNAVKFPCSDICIVLWEFKLNEWHAFLSVVTCLSVIVLDVV